MAQTGLPGEFEVYYGPERMLISLDVGHAYSSVAITHLQFGRVPAVRTVTRYPGGHTSSRTPSTIAYDLKDRPRAHGAEATQSDVVARGKVEGWTVVTGFKSQMHQTPEEDPKASSSSKTRNKLARKLKPDRAASLAVPSIPSSPSTLSLNSLQSPSSSGFPLFRSLTPDRLVDSMAGTDVRASAEIERHATPSPPPPPPSPTPRWRKQSVSSYEGPVLKLIYADHIKHLVACVRAWFNETTPDGDETFMRLWDTCTFIFPHPADWGTPETDTIREAMQVAKLIPSAHQDLRDRLIFLKEPAAIVYFTRRHVSPSCAWWTASQAPFVVCDSAEVATSVVGYKVAALDPLIKLQPYEPLSRIEFGAAAVSRAFQEWITKKLSKTKFKGADVTASIMEQFEQKVKCKFLSPNELFEFRLAETGNDSNHGIKDGVLKLSGVKIEDMYLPTVSAIIARLSAVVSLGEAKAIVLAGGFGESPYLQRRLRETFEPRGVAIVVTDIPALTAVSDGAMRFYLTHTIRPKPTRFDLGVSSAVDWSKNWQKGMDRPVFVSVSGKRSILGRWTAIVPKGTLLDPAVPISKVYNVKYALEAKDASFRVDLWAHDPSSEPSAEGWMTDMAGVPYPNFAPVCTVEADLASLVASLPVRGQAAGEDERRRWVQVDLELIVYVGTESLEACVRWMENGVEKRGPSSRIPSEFF